MMISTRSSTSAATISASDGLQKFNLNSREINAL